MTLLAMILGCGELTKPASEWAKAKRIAGKEQGLSHVSGLVIDDKFAYVTIGGTVLPATIVRIPNGLCTLHGWLVIVSSQAQTASGRRYQPVGRVGNAP